MAYRMLSAGLFTILATTALGAPPGLAAGLCPSGASLQAFIDLGACTIDDKSFSGFSIAPHTFSGVTQLDFTTTDVVVSVNATPGNPGLAFALPPLSIGRDQLKEGEINFTVTVLPGGAAIEDVALTDSATAQGVGFAGVSVALSNGVFASIVTNEPQGTLVCAPSCVPGTVAEVPFAPTTSLAVTAALLLNDNAQQHPDPQGASVSEFAVNFSEVPEPGTASVLALALGVFGGIRRRRARA